LPAAMHQAVRARVSASATPGDNFNFVSRGPAGSII
jgi:hypothetical protein